MRRTLVVTNDFPPRPGGIQQFVHQMLEQLPAQDVVVLTSRHRDRAQTQASLDAVVPPRAAGGRLMPLSGREQKGIDSQGLVVAWRPKSRLGIDILLLLLISQ